MSSQGLLPRILIIDDLLGRTHPDRPNRERANLCGQYLLEDITRDQEGKGPTVRIVEPIAQACFYRGQQPACSVVGDRVENDMAGILDRTRDGWVTRKPEEIPWSLLLLDLCFYTGIVTERSNRETPGMPEGQPDDDRPESYFGLKVLQEVRRHFPGLPVVVFSSRSRHEVVEQFADYGAVDFLPRETERGAEVLGTIIRRHALIPDGEGTIVGHAIPLLIALRNARRLAPSRQSVLIVGERGTGKELLARYIHRHRTSGAPRPFVPANSSVFTPELFASELFGIEARVATGVERRSGLIRSADGGDLFLDEIRHMPPQVQASLLRVLEDGKVVPVGSTTPQPVNVSFIFATNSNLDALAVSGGFSPDLLDRLRLGGSVWVPPLRDRAEDMSLLVEQFLRKAESEYGGIRREVSPDALMKLQSHHWPGHVRELHACVFHAVRSYPGVERLSPVHIQIIDIDSQVLTLDRSNRDVQSQDVDPQSATDLDYLIECLGRLDLESVSRSKLVGRLRDLQNAYARVAAGLVRAGLVATSRATPHEPEGKLQIHPAVKLLMGDSGLTASKAADLIKKFLAVSPKAAEPLLLDPLLREALQRAVALRPPKAKRTLHNT